MEDDKRNDREYLEGKITIEELAERRRRNLERKEFENDIDRNLDLEFRKVDHEKRSNRERNKFLDGVLIFFTTLAILYVLLFSLKIFVLTVFEFMLSYLGFYTGWINPLLHALAWTGAVISVVRRRSILDEFFDRYY